MSTAARMQTLGGSPAGNAAQTVIALAAAPHLDSLLDAEEMARASAVLSSVLVAAMGAGFVDSDLLLALAARQRWTGAIEDMAAEIVQRIGGPDELFALLDLSTTMADWIGLEP